MLDRLSSRHQKNTVRSYRMRKPVNRHPDLEIPIRQISVSCSICQKEYALPKISICLSCLRKEAKELKKITEVVLPPRIWCQITKMSINVHTCQTMQGGAQCKNCHASTRVCEQCKIYPVCEVFDGLCLHCAIVRYES